MTTTLVSVYNLTLANLGIDPNVESETEETKKRRVLSSVYDFSRKTILKAHNWGFATAYATLSPVGTKPTDWSYQYAWPNAMLKPRYIVQAVRNADPIPFRVGQYSDNDNGLQKVIWTDEANAEMAMTVDTLDLDLWTTEAIETLAAYMAFRTAHPFTDSKSKQNDMYQLYLRTMADAAQIDALTNADDEEQEADWIRARNGGI